MNLENCRAGIDWVFVVLIKVHLAVSVWKGENKIMLYQRKIELNYNATRVPRRRLITGVRDPMILSSSPAFENCGLYHVIVCLHVDKYPPKNCG